MEDLRKQTIETYNQSADELAEYFRNTGARVGDIELALSLAGEPENPQILEIGFGSARDAEEIIKHAGYYKGIDTAQAFVDKARKKLPHGNFELANAVTYEYEGKYDVVYAFAVLRHMNQEETTTVLTKVNRALRDGGIFYISLQYAEDYKETVRKDEFGTRVQYLYSPQLIRELAGQGYVEVYGAQNMIGDTAWFEIALKKVPVDA